jgi:hypothetical protein
MNPVQKIVERFGSLSAMARAVGVPISTAQWWRDTGIVPARRQAALLRAGQHLNPPLSAADLIVEVAGDE